MFYRSPLVGWLTAFLTMVIFISCSNRKRACINLHQGNYYYELPHGLVRITRTDSLQTEYDVVKDSVTVYRIKWDNECTYQLIRKTKRRISNSEHGKLTILEYRNARPIIVEVQEIKKEFYQYRMKRPEYNEFIYGRVWSRIPIGGFKSMSETFNAN